VKAAGSRNIAEYTADVPIFPDCWRCQKFTAKKQIWFPSSGNKKILIKATHRVRCRETLRILSLEWDTPFDLAKRDLRARVDVPEKYLRANTPVHASRYFFKHYKRRVHARTHARMHARMVVEERATLTWHTGIESQGLPTPELHAARQQERLRGANLHIISSTRYRAWYHRAGDLVILCMRTIRACSKHLQSFRPPLRDVPKNVFQLLRWLFYRELLTIF